jgi:hypothetical protein
MVNLVEWRRSNVLHSQLSVCRCNNNDLVAWSFWISIVGATVEKVSFAGHPSFRATSCKVTWNDPKLMPANKKLQLVFPNLTNLTRTVAEHLFQHVVKTVTMKISIWMLLALAPVSVAAQGFFGPILGLFSGFINFVLGIIFPKLDATTCDLVYSNLGTLGTALKASCTCNAILGLPSSTLELKCKGQQTYCLDQNTSPPSFCGAVVATATATASTVPPSIKGATFDAQATITDVPNVSKADISITCKFCMFASVRVYLSHFPFVTMAYLTPPLRLSQWDLI